MGIGAEERDVEEGGNGLSRKTGVKRRGMGEGVDEGQGRSKSVLKSVLGGRVIFRFFGWPQLKTGKILFFRRIWYFTTNSGCFNIHGYTYTVYAHIYKHILCMCIYSAYTYTNSGCFYIHRYTYTAYAHIYKHI